MTHEECEVRDKKIREMRAGGMNLAVIAKKFDLTQARISQLCQPIVKKKAVPSRYVSAWLPCETVDALKALAKEKKLSMSAIVKEAISDYFKKKK